MNSLLLEVLRQIDNGNSIERTLVNADTATNTELLRYVGNLILGSYFDAHLSCSDHWARFFALLSTSFGLTSVGLDDGNSGAGVTHGTNFAFWHYDF